MNSPKVALITLNLNGKPVLEKLFSSIKKHVNYPNYELIVVDHGSTDGSLELIEQWSEKLNIITHARGENYSFSDSNNFAAKITDAEYLVLINNDIWFEQDIITQSLSSYIGNEVDLLGIKLKDREVQSEADKSSTQHIGVYFDFSSDDRVIKPFEARVHDPLCNDALINNGLVEVPVVTGAFMVTTRELFLSLDGFDEEYFYGYEDVDLCLKYQENELRVICDTNITAFHSHGFSRKKFNPALASKQINNRQVLDGKYGAKLREWYRESLFTKPGFWSGRKPVIAFAVTEASSDTLAGDYFTAYELAYYLQKEQNCECFFVEHKKNWFDLKHADVLIAMRDDYNPREIKSQNPNLIKVAWVRNWFERFTEHSFSKDFDLIWASSTKSASFISEKLNKPVDVVRIATNPERFESAQFEEKFESDYTFTGSIWGAYRDIVNNLKPLNLPYNFKVFGGGWSELSDFSAYDQGPVPYSAMPNIYASTKIVIDDANSVTKEWGSVNSRVFDALGAGKLVFTNGKLGSEDSFEGSLPTYDSRAELERLLDYYLNNSEEYYSLVDELKQQVLTKHTYSVRAREVIDILKSKTSKLKKIAIKIGCPRLNVAHEWGDYHFANAMKKCFDLMGYSARVDCIDKWYGPESLGDDIVIALRGLSKYEPLNHQINLMWNISHPDKISFHEYESYDHVFIASLKHAKFIDDLITTPVTPLLQCTDPDLFKLPTKEELASIELDDKSVLFVGNSRGTYRQIVKDALEQDITIDVYGGNWTKYIPEEYIKGTYIDNSELYKFYGKANFILNDHWSSMAHYGFISNRVFDALASGASIVTDEVEGIKTLFGNTVQVYTTPKDLKNMLSEKNILSQQKRKKIAKDIRENHSFQARVNIIIGIAKNITEL